MMIVAVFVTVCDDGLEYLARYSNQATAGSFMALALGSSNAAESTSATGLTTEITTGGGQRQAATVSYEATAKAVWYKSFSITDTLAVNECGVFNSATAAGSKMLMRHLFSSTKNVSAGDTFQLTMKLTLAR